MNQQSGSVGVPHASRLRGVLRSLHTASPEIEASAVISGDGLLIASHFDIKLDADRCAAMCASLLALAERVSKETSRGDLQVVIVQGELGVMLLARASGEHVLAVVAHAKANLGLTLNLAKKAVASMP